MREVAGGKAFGDWTLWADDGREFTEHGIVLYQAPLASARKDRTDPAILLEVYQWIRDREGGLRHGDPGLWGRRLSGPGGPGQASRTALSIFTNFDHLNREMFTVFDRDFHGH